MKQILLIIELQKLNEKQILSMKKIYDWNVKVFIMVSNTQKKIQIICSVHNSLHQIKIMIAKKLQLSILDTHIDLYFRGDQPLKPTSTLLQNQVTNESLLSAKIVRTKEYTNLPIQNIRISKTGKERINQIKSQGLTVSGSCTNQSCVNFNQKIEINFGIGTFPILEIASYTKCQFCPYKSQFMRPNMMSHHIYLEKCYFRLKGKKFSSCSILIEQETQMKKCERRIEISQMINQFDWKTNMQLLVKAL